jgi:hypothetical protein
MARLNVGWLFALSLAACAGCSVDTSGLMPSDAIPDPDASSVFLDASAPDATTPLDSSPGDEAALPGDEMAVDATASADGWPEGGPASAGEAGSSYDGSFDDAPSTLDADSGEQPADASTTDEGASQGEGGSSDDGAASDDGAGGMDAPLGPWEDAAVCAAIADTGQTVGVSVSVAATPGAMGGVIPSGTYLLTSLTSYGGSALCATVVAQGTAVVVASDTMSGTINSVVDLTAFGETTQETLNDTYVTSGPTLTLTPACPPASTESPVQYTVGQGQITVIEPSPIAICGTAVEVFSLP